MAPVLVAPVTGRIAAGELHPTLEESSGTEEGLSAPAKIHGSWRRHTQRLLAKLTQRLHMARCAHFGTLHPKAEMYREDGLWFRDEFAAELYKALR